MIAPLGQPGRSPDGRRSDSDRSRHANGSTTVTLKLYAVEGTPAADWFARLKKGEQHLDDPRLVHGVLTYDYFSMIRAIGDQADGALDKPPDWVEVRFPLALVILGPTNVVPWTIQ